MRPRLPRRTPLTLSPAQRFAAVIMRIRDPKTTALIFASGKMARALRCLCERGVRRFRAAQRRPLPAHSATRRATGMAAAASAKPRARGAVWLRR
jgi:hypothetical protein